MTVLPGLDSPARVAAASCLGVGAAAAMVWRFGWSAALPGYFVFATAGATVTVTDVCARLVPNRIVAPAWVLGVGLLAVPSADSSAWWPLARAGLGSVLLGGFYLALGLVFRAGMGLGDVKWAAVIGLYLAYLGWSALPSATVIAFGAAAIVVLATAAVRQRRGLTLPMAPFMTAGAIVAVLTTR